MSEDYKQLSPEQLLELVDSGKLVISDVSNGASPSPSTLDSQLHATSSGCSLEEVKDRVMDSLPVVETIYTAPAGAENSNEHVNNSKTNNGTITDDVVRMDRKAVNEKIADITSIKSAPRRVALIDDFDGLDIRDPVELLFILDENIANGTTKLHDWQIRFMIDFADSRHTKESPFQAVVQACNSSGKDKYVIAACAVWLCMRYREVECPITSSSGNQLDNQTGAHIDRLTAKANAIFGKLWKINYRYYEFMHVGELGEPMPSKLKLFATDEAGKAEGFHPIDAGKKMAIFTSETKSIPEEITSALERCHGFTHRVDASSPGIASGYFYNTCSSGIPREEVEDIKDVSSVQTILYKITAYQCPHITESEINRVAAKTPGGKSSAIFKSSILAEFGSTDEMVVIPSNFVWNAVCDLPKRKKEFSIVYISEPFNEAGLDLSDGGAETVLAVRNGNKLLGIDAFRFEDTEDTIDYLEERFKFWHLTSKYALIRGDYCGMGGPMLRALKRRKWSNIRFVDSRNKAAEPKTYSNRGTELFFHMRDLLQNKNIILFYDKLLIEQLCTRYYKLREGMTYQLLSKVEQKSKGFPSPDRADALNLAFWNYKGTTIDVDSLAEPFKDEEPKKTYKQIRDEESAGDFDMREWSTRHMSKWVPDHLDHDTLQEELLAYNQQRQRNR